MNDTVYYETLLMNELSRRHMERVAHEIGNDRQKFALLMEIVMHGKEPVVQRAAWAMDACLEKYPELLLPYIETLIDALPSFTNDGVKRQIVKALATCSIPKSRQGQLADLCFTWLQSSITPVAVKIHCMQILANIAVEYPDLAMELQVVIREQMPRNSVGFLSRGRKVLKQLAELSLLL